MGAVTDVISAMAASTVIVPRGTAEHGAEPTPSRYPGIPLWCCPAAA